MRIFCHQRELRVVTGGYRWIWVVTEDSMFKVKPNVTDKHTNTHTPRWHYIKIIILDLIIISLWKSARSANRVQQQVPQVHSSHPLWEEILKNVSGLQKKSEVRWEHQDWWNLDPYVGWRGNYFRSRKSLKDDETCETMLRCWQSIKCKIPDAQS